MAIINGTAGNDVRFGTALADTFNLFAGNDIGYGRAGNDIMNGGDGNDRLYGEDGNDRLYGQNGNDFLSGGNGNDYIDGGTGTNTAYGGTGNDTIRSSGSGAYYGGSGNDYIYAGLGTSETLNGGSGWDTLNTTSWNGAYEINLITGVTNYTGESFTNFENLITGNGLSLIHISQPTRPY